LSTQSLVNHELPLVENLVREAGQLVRHFYDKGATVHWKGDGDPVTAADEAANEHLVTGLQSLFPTDGILAEESTDDLTRLARHRLWLVDPLDGTKEFVSHIDEFSIMVGLAIDGIPVLGVVYQPVQDLLLRAVPGMLAQLVQRDSMRPLAVTNTADPAAMRLVASRSHRNPLVDGVRRRLGLTQERPSGSVGLKVALLATGQCDLYIHPAPGLKEWDTCAPDAILRAAGGIMTDAWGRPLAYNQRDHRQRQGLVASNGQIHDQIVNAVATLAEADGYQAGNGF
jgi:3'(2'), 5'-bisphosphate nucleotidase